MRVLFTFAIALALFVIPTSAALAGGKILQCGVPQDVDMPTEVNVDFCDIYTRQLEYRKKRITFREKLDERSKNYAAIGIQARNNYLENLAALHASYDDE